VDYAHKFNEGDKVLWSHNETKYPATVKAWHGNKTYVVTIEAKKSKYVQTSDFFAYEDELRAE
jgi:hypothetical protein